MGTPAEAEQRTGILTEFKDFVLRGNVVDLAVAVVVGAAGAAVVKSLVTNLISPLIGAILGQPSFADMTFRIGSAVFRYGAFVDALITFVTIIAALFFLVIKPMEKIKSIAGAAEDAAGLTEAELLTEIRDLLKEKAA